MVILKMARAALSEEAAATFEARLETIPIDFKPLIRPSRALQAEILGIAPPLQTRRPSPSAMPTQYELVEDDSRVRSGEIFTDGRAMYVVSLLAEPRSRRGRSERSQDQGGHASALLQLSYIGPDLNPGTLLSITTSLNATFAVQLEPHHFTSRRFQELKQDGRESPPPASSEELAGAVVLRDRATRALATAIKASGGLLVRDLPKQISEDARHRVDHMQQTLIETGLIESEIVVVCTKTQAQTARAPSRTVLENLAGSGLKCACGRLIVEERIEEALTITPAGRNQLDKSRWLTALVLAELEAVGVPRDRTLIEVQEGGDEFDLLADISGELAFFELKDKDFNLGNAYSFGAKIGIVRPEHPVIVTTASVGNDAKDHFQRARMATRSGRGADFVWEPGGMFSGLQPGDIRYIEGVEELSSGIRKLATQIYRADAMRVLSGVLPFALLDPNTLVGRIDQTGTPEATREDAALASEREQPGQAQGT